MTESVRRRVLIVSRELPPAIGPHPIRVAKLAKYLPEFGWDPTILSVPVDHVVLRDDDLAAEIADVPVVRVSRLLARAMPPVPDSGAGSGVKPGALPRTDRGGAAADEGRPRSVPRRSRLRLAGGMLVPDPAVLWAIPASRRAGAIADQFDAVLTTAPPFSTHLVGDALARRHGLPWVAEYRDNWTTNRLYRRVAPIQWLNERLEHRILRTAGAVVVVSEAAAAEMRSAFPEVAGKIHIARNGFDPDDLPPRAARATEFEIAYAGSLIARRTPRALFEAFARLIDERPEIRDAIRLHLMGWIDDLALEGAYAALGKERVAFDGLLSHREALARASHAAVLLGFNTRTETGAAGGTSKLFEYMALQRPVLVLAPEGPARQLVRDSGCGLGVDPEDVAAIAAAIGQLFDEWRLGTERAAPADLIAGLTRRATAGAVAAALDAAVSAKEPAAH